MPFIKFRDVPEPFGKRLAIAETPENPWLEPNCYGTALFLMGILPHDVCIYNKHVPKLLKLLDEVEELKDNSLVFSLREKEDEKYIEHLAYVRSVNPFEGFQRTGCCGSFEQIKSMQGIRAYLDVIFPKFSTWCPNVAKNPVKWVNGVYILPEDKSKREELNNLAREIIEGYSPSG